MENVTTITYRSTHYYLIDCPAGKLMLDSGWVGEMPRLLAALKSYKIQPSEIKYVLPTHNHPDHAGLVQNIKQVCGARLLIHEKQVPYLPELAAMFKGKDIFLPISIDPTDVVLPTPNRQILHGLGIPGEVIETPGHSDDSVSLVLDSGLAFTGDLTPPMLAGEDNAETLRASWQRLLDHGAKIFYPAHSEPVKAEVIKEQLAGL